MKKMYTTFSYILAGMLLMIFSISCKKEQEKLLITPLDITATAISVSRIDIYWADISDETEYKIERKTIGGNYSFIATLGANVHGYSDTGLTANTVYTYRVYPT